MPKLSAALLLYRVTEGGVEVLIGHPGGPFWARKDEGAWSIPKGEYVDGEDPWSAAQREFLEEVGKEPPAGPRIDFAPLRQPSGKVITATQIKVAANLRSLFQYLIDNQYLEEITEYHPEYLRIHPSDVLAKLQSGDSSWEQRVPPEVVHIIKKREFFGYRRPIAA